MITKLHPLGRSKDYNKCIWCKCIYLTALSKACTQVDFCSIACEGAYDKEIHD